MMLPCAQLDGFAPGVASNCGIEHLVTVKKNRCENQSNSALPKATY